MSGPNPIQVAELLAYMHMVGIASQRERSKYLRIVQEMDQTYLTYQAEKAEQSKPKS